MRTEPDAASFPFVRARYGRQRRGSKPLKRGTPATDPASGKAGAASAVVLIDEIDKADPDVPNDLLEPFDRKTFTVRETGDEITASETVLMILTTNRERTMPRAFVRNETSRCRTSRPGRHSKRRPGSGLAWNRPARPATT